MKKMKSTTKILASFLFLAVYLMVNSCGKDFLDRASETEIPEDQISAEATRIEGQVNGLYASLKSGALYGGRYLIYNDIRGDEFINRAQNGVTGFTVYLFTNDASDSYVGNFWVAGYLTINRVNIFLDEMAKLKPNVITDAKKKEYIAEAKFVRAMAYYALVQLFAKPYVADNGASKGIPLRLKPEKTTENNAIQRSTVKAIYDQILKDLNESEIDAPLRHSNGYRTSTRAHKNTVIAFKTRVYLAMKNFPKVIEEGNKLVTATAPFKTKTGTPQELLGRVATVYTDKISAERILSFPFELTNIPGTQNQLSYYYNIGNLEYHINTSVTGIYNNPNWPATDARKRDLTDLYANTFRFLTKFTDVETYLDWVPAIRYAEVLLNLAEAEAEEGDEARALALLKAIRHRSDANYVFPTFDSRAKLVEAILLERRIELLGEGFRIPDLQRRNMPIVSVGAAKSILPTDPEYIFPIPLREIIDNPDINK